MTPLTTATRWRRQATQWALALCLGCSAVTGLMAAEALPLAEDPVVEARLIDISQELRCLVCQNESLASSHAELADDLRREVREPRADDQEQVGPPASGCRLRGSGAPEGAHI